MTDNLLRAVERGCVTPSGKNAAMCMLCDGYSEGQARHTTELQIVTHGWSVAGVAPRPDDPPGGAQWAYTIGLTESYEHPELVVVNLVFDAAGQLLNTVGDLVANGQSLDEVDAQLGTRHRDVHPERVLETELFNGWGFHYQREPPADGFVQVVPPPGWFCPCHRNAIPDLSRPLPPVRTDRAARRRVERARRKGRPVDQPWNVRRRDAA